MMMRIMHCNNYADYDNSTDTISEDDGDEGMIVNNYADNDNSTDDHMKMMVMRIMIVTIMLTMTTVQMTI